MSLEYYLYCRKSYDRIIQEIESIINSYDNIFNVTFGCENIDKIYLKNLLSSNKKAFFIEKKVEAEEQKKICNKHIYDLCCHEMIDDEIDITPERSQKIRYCVICEYTE
jgi:hypothetical protein